MKFGPTFAEMRDPTLLPADLRKRALEARNDYAVRWLTEQEENVIGGNGFRFQSVVMRSNGGDTKLVNDRTEAAGQTQALAANYPGQGGPSASDGAASDQLTPRSVAGPGL